MTVNSIVQKLKNDVFLLQSDTSPKYKNVNLGNEVSENYFRQLSTGSIHEFISKSSESSVCTIGFIFAAFNKIVSSNGNCIWICNPDTIFPPAFKSYNINPARIIFIDVNRPKEALWTIEEALKCKSISCVVGEVQELSFNESRRLQLAVEKSGVTGFIHRHKPRSENITACVTRWKISPIPSQTEDGMPGLGFPRWDVNLTKVRNGKPGRWQVEWRDNTFHYLPQTAIAVPDQLKQKTG